MTHIQKQTYSVPEAAKILGIGRSLAYEIAAAGQIPTIRIGKRILIPIAGLEKFLSGEWTPPEIGLNDENHK